MKEQINKVKGKEMNDRRNNVRDKVKNRLRAE